MLKKLVSLVLALALLLSGIPPIPAQAETEQPLDVQQMDDGSYVIELKDASDYSLRSAFGLRRAPQNEPNSITPETDPDKFTTRTVRVDFGDLVNEVLKVDQVKLTVENKQVNYSQEYTVTKDGDVASGDKVIGQNFDVPVPAGEHYNRTRFIVHFPDGRDARALVEGLYKPEADGGIYVITVEFLAHTGVATEWYGASERPNVQAVYTYLANGEMLFDLPTENQNSILRKGDALEWAGHDNPVYLQKLDPANILCSDRATGDYTYHVKINGKTEGQLGTSNYFFKVTGDPYTGFTVTSRQDLKVKFDPNGGTWKGTAPAEQTIGHSMKLADSWAGRGPIAVPTGDDLMPPSVPAGQPAKKFIGWNTDANATTALFTDNTYAQPITKDETFYAIYAEKAQGKANAVYKDKATDEAIPDKCKIAGKEYPAELKGNKDEKIADAVFVKKDAPKFIGYEIDSITTKPVPEPPNTANYTENGDYTVIYTYNKLDPIIPAKDDNGNPNPKATEDVKATYIPVTIKVDGDKGTFQKNNAGVDGTEFVYYVNPVEGKSLDDVLTASGLTAKSKDVNANKIDEQKPWKFTPAKTEGQTPADVALATEVNKDNFTKGVTMEVNFVQTKADQFKDKLKPVDIKVWKGEEITWKKGVALKEANDDLQAILDKDTTVVSDLGEGGTIAAPKIARTSKEANLPNGAKGNLKVTFDDGSSLAVNDQTVYVSPEKVKDDGKINPENLPTDKIKVEIKLGEGVQVGTTKGDKTTPVVYAGFYLKPNTGLAADDFPAVEAQENYKPGSVKWNPADQTKAWSESGEYVAKAEKQTIAEKVGQGNLAGVDFGVWVGDTID